MSNNDIFVRVSNRISASILMIVTQVSPIISLSKCPFYTKYFSIVTFHIPQKSLLFLNRWNDK